MSRWIREEFAFLEPTTMIWTAPSVPSTIAFVSVVLVVCAMAVLGVRQTWPNRTLQAGLISMVWLAATAGLAESGKLEAGLPQSLGIVLGGLNLTALLFGLSKFGRQMSESLSYAALVGFQAFRLPLELVLHRWSKEGVVPITMTWEGLNWDIVTGLLALILLPLLLRPGLRAWHRRIALGFSVVGLGLLLNVARVAVLSSPVPFRKFFDEPVLQVAFHAPTIWIIAVCVMGALAAHVILLRKCFRQGT